MNSSWPTIGCNTSSSRPSIWNVAMSCSKSRVLPMNLHWGSQLEWFISLKEFTADKQISYDENFMMISIIVRTDCFILFGTHSGANFLLCFGSSEKQSVIEIPKVLFLVLWSIAGLASCHTYKLVITWNADMVHLTTDSVERQAICIFCRGVITPRLAQQTYHLQHSDTSSLPRMLLCTSERRRKDCCILDQRHGAILLIIAKTSSMQIPNRAPVGPPFLLPTELACTGCVDGDLPYHSSSLWIMTLPLFHP